MADEHLTERDFEVICEALRHSRQAIRDYREYPSEDFRATQLETVAATEKKLRSMRRAAAGGRSDR